MGSMSDVWEKKVLDLILRNTGASATAPMGLDTTSVWIGLGTAGSDGSFTELAATNGYARVAVPRTGAGWDAAINTSPALSLNTAAVTFPTASGGDWNGAANITHAGIFAAATVGVADDIYWTAVNTPKPVLNGDTPAFGIGQLQVTQD